ncbi:MAG: pantoate kinase [Candidatus Ranarchaeia archaeon]
MPSATAFSPAGISSFFQACLTDANGQFIADPIYRGSRGGGFSIQKGIVTEVTLSPSRGPTRVKIAINDVPQEAVTSMAMIGYLLPKKSSFDITVDHRISVPIGAGFGTSGAGAFSLGLALNELLGSPYTYMEVARFAHCAEIDAATGLGTVSGLAWGNGLILVIEPGAPGIGRTDSIPCKPDLRLIAVTFAPISKSSIIQNQYHLNQINEIGGKTLAAILRKPTLENFLGCCKEFAINTELITAKQKRLIDGFLDAGAIGATVNMIGDAVHALVHKDQVNPMLKIAKKLGGDAQILISPLSFTAAHLL